MTTIVVSPFDLDDMTVETLQEHVRRMPERRPGWSDGLDDCSLANTYEPVMLEQMVQPGRKAMRALEAELAEMADSDTVRQSMEDER